MTMVVLINDCGCEIAREEITETQGYEDIIKDWIIYPGDTIKVEDVWTEEG